MNETLKYLMLRSDPIPTGSIVRMAICAGFIVLIAGCTCPENGEKLTTKTAEPRDVFQDNPVFPQKESITLLVNSGLGLFGRCEMKWEGLSSETGNTSKKRLRMARFYAGDYKVLAKEAMEVMGAKLTEVNIQNRTDVSCDLFVAGNFDDLTVVIANLALYSGPYEFKRERGSYSANFVMNQKGDSHLKGNIFRVSYEGEIISNNANHYDPQSHMMSWEEDKTLDVQFILRLEPDETK